MTSSASGSSLQEVRKMQRDDVTQWPSMEPPLSEERSGRSSGSLEDDMTILEANLRIRLHEWGPLLTAAQSILVWERPLPSLLTAAALHSTFWLFSYLSLRPVFLLCLFLLVFLSLDNWKTWLVAHCKVPPRVEPSNDSEAVSGSGHHRLLSVPELCHYLAESWITCQLCIQELLLYKKQNPGRFCAVVCSGCAVMAVVGHYVPGIMISYIILLSVVLWPLVVYRELIQRMYTALEPVLMKLDYSMKGEGLHRSHKKRQAKKETEEGEQLVAETDSESEIELSGLSPQLDVRITALALSITDSELSDEEASILESGGFSVSRATTPQLTDVSEDLDQPNTVTEEGPDTKKSTASPQRLGHHMSDEKPLFEPDMPHSSAQSLNLNPEELLPTLTSPLHFVNTHFNGKGQVVAMEGDIQTLTEESVSDHLSPALQSPVMAAASLAHVLPESQESGGDGEDFELLEQEELDHMEQELEEEERQRATHDSQMPSTVPGQEQPPS